MKKTALNWLAIATLFLGSIAVIINRYTETSEVEEATTEGLSIVGLALVWFVGVIALSFLITNIKGYIQQHAFGRVAITVYSAVFLFLSYSLWLFISVIKNGAQANVDQFISNMTYHMHTLWLLMIVAAIALAIVWLDWVLYGVKKLYDKI